jgi:hypothetical protein
MSKSKLPKRVLGVPVRGMFTKKFNRGMFAGAMLPLAAMLIRGQARHGSFTRNLLRRPRQVGNSMMSTGKDTAAAFANVASGASGAVGRAIDNLFSHVSEREAEGRSPRRSAKGNEKAAIVRKRKNRSEERIAHH